MCQSSSCRRLIYDERYTEHYELEPAMAPAHRKVLTTDERHNIRTQFRLDKPDDVNAWCANCADHYEVVEKNTILNILRKHPSLIPTTGASNSDD